VVGRTGFGIRYSTYAHRTCLSRETGPFPSKPKWRETQDALGREGTPWTRGAVADRLAGALPGT
jgi:hypothetical protein